MQGFLNTYIRNLQNLLSKVDVSLIEQVIYAIEKTIENKAQIYVLGNGGSSATASHMVNCQVSPRCTIPFKAIA